MGTAVTAPLLPLASAEASHWPIVHTGRVGTSCGYQMRTARGQREQGEGLQGMQGEDKAMLGAWTPLPVLASVRVPVPVLGRWPVPVPGRWPVPAPEPGRRMLPDYSLSRGTASLLQGGIQAGKKAVHPVLLPLLLPPLLRQEKRHHDRDWLRDAGADCLSTCWQDCWLPPLPPLSTGLREPLAPTLLRASGSCLRGSPGGAMAVLAMRQGQQLWWCHSWPGCAASLLPIDQPSD